MGEGELRLQICGPLAIEHPAGTIVEARLPGRQGRRLWAYLVLNRGRAVARDELASAIWADDIPDAWDDSLNALASRLRAVLRGVGGLAVRGEIGRYTLELPAGTFIDFDRAWRALLRAEVALRERDVSTALMEALVARSIAARGFLAGEGGPWVEAQRRALADTRVQASELAADAELAGGAALHAERIAREIVALDPLRESGYRLLMRSLVASGNGAGVGRVMEECRSSLRLAGASPSPETERVFRELAGVAR